MLVASSQCALINGTVNLLRMYPCCGKLAIPSPPEFQAVIQYAGHKLLSGVFHLNDVSVTFALSI